MFKMILLNTVEKKNIFLRTLIFADKNIAHIHGLQKAVHFWFFSVKEKHVSN